MISCLNNNHGRVSRHCLSLFTKETVGLLIIETSDDSENEEGSYHGMELLEVQ